MGRKPWQHDLDYDPHCRRCSAPLMIDNARISRGRFIGICRACEAAVKQERYHAEHPDARFYTDRRRHYPIPATVGRMTPDE